MKTIKYILISLISLFFISESVAQSSCELDHLVPVKEAIGEENDTLPELDPPPPYESFSRSSEGPRMLYLIHGLNGDEESWDKAADAVEFGAPNFLPLPFPARLVISERPEYKSTLGLNSATLSVRSSIDDPPFSSLPEDYNKYEGIAIGHSQGGIVGRNLDKFYSHRNTAGDLVNASQRCFGGLVTVATPNQGAQILNNEDFLHGLVYDLADNLTAGPYKELRNNDSYFVELMVSLVNFSQMRDSIVNFLGNKVGSFLITEGMPAITDEYTVPGPTGKGLTSKIPDLNAYVPVILQEDNEERKTSLVAFYAVADLIKTYHNVPVDEIVGFVDGPYVSQPNWETKNIDEIIVPISWGTIHFQLNSPNDGIDPFEADNEDYLTAYRMHQTKHFYDSKVLQNEIKRQKYRSNAKNAAWGLNPLYFHYDYKRKKARKRRDAWDRGSVMLSKFDELYRIAIGARYQEITSEVYYTTLCDCDDPNFPFLIDCDLVNELHINILDCEEIIIVENEYYNIEWRNKDSDGVVLAESARDIPEDQSTWEPQRLDGVTHMQVRNTSHTAQMLETVFEGGVGDFFITEKK